MVRAFTRLLMVAALLAGLALADGAWWLHSPMALNLPAGSPVLDLEVEPGTRAAQVAEIVVASGAQTPVQLLQLWFRVSGQARQIKAGSYEITPGMTPRKLHWAPCFTHCVAKARRSWHRSMDSRPCCAPNRTRNNSTVHDRS